MNHPIFHLKTLENEEHAKHKANKREEIRKIRAGLNETEKRKTTEKIDANKTWFFKNISKTDKLQLDLPGTEEVRLTKRRNERGAITINITEIKGL